MTRNYFLCIRCFALVAVLSFAGPLCAKFATTRVDVADNFVEQFYSSNGYNWDCPAIGAARLGAGGTSRVVQSLWWGQMYEFSRHAGNDTSTLTIPDAVLAEYGSWFKGYFDKHQLSAGEKASTTETLRLARIASDLSDAGAKFPALQPEFAEPIFNDYFRLFGSKDPQGDWARFEKTIHTLLQNDKPADVAAIILLAHVPAEWAGRAAAMLLALNPITDGEAAFVYEDTMEVLKYRRMFQGSGR